jgi:hypothetical protein
MIDISAVQAFHTVDDIRSMAALALEKQFIAAHALPRFVPLLGSLIPVGLHASRRADRLPFRWSHDHHQARGGARSFKPTSRSWI